MIEGIDLTLEATFWGDHAPAARPESQHFYQQVTGSGRCGSEGILTEDGGLARALRRLGFFFDDLNDAGILYDHRRERENDDWQDCYYKLFGAPSPELRHVDPLAHFLFSNGVVCDRCGSELNPLNRAGGSGYGYSGICQACEREFFNETNNDDFFNGRT